LVAPTGEHLVIGYLVGIKLAANTTVTDPCNYTLFSFYDASGDNVTPTTCTGDVADAEGVAAVNMSATFGIKAALLNSKTGAFSYIASARVPSASINVQVFSSIAAVRYQSDEQWSER
jgi:hypothetical protein